MELTIQAPVSFFKLPKNQQKIIVEEIQSELEKKTLMIKGFQQPVEDFEDWGKVGFETTSELDSLNLDDIDVTVSTKEQYLNELSRQISIRQELDKSFFCDSEPIDIGYTDAGILDSIIGSFKK